MMTFIYDMDIHKAAELEQRDKGFNILEEDMEMFDAMLKYTTE